eukprot:scaffold172_cov254-Pinguiococcus_pyrenoidosus.AAC.33
MRSCHRPSEVGAAQVNSVSERTADACRVSLKRQAYDPRTSRPTPKTDTSDASYADTIRGKAARTSPGLRNSKGKLFRSALPPADTVSVVIRSAFLDGSRHSMAASLSQVATAARSPSRRQRYSSVGLKPTPAIVTAEVSYTLP